MVIPIPSARCSSSVVESRFPSLFRLGRALRTSQCRASSFIALAKGLTVAYAKPSCPRVRRIELLLGGTRQTILTSVAGEGWLALRLAFGWVVSHFVGIRAQTSSLLMCRSIANHRGVISQFLTNLEVLPPSLDPTPKFSGIVEPPAQKRQQPAQC